MKTALGCITIIAVLVLAALLIGALIGIVINTVEALTRW